MGELLGRTNNVGFQYYGERLKKTRKLLKSQLDVDAMKGWHSLLDESAFKLVESFAMNHRLLHEHVSE